MRTDRQLRRSRPEPRRRSASGHAGVMAVVAVVCIASAIGCKRKAPTTVRDAGGNASVTKVAAPVPTGPLPRGVTPHHYDLTLEIDPTKPRFSGRARIQITLEKPQRRIWLHGLGLMVRGAKIAVGGAPPLTLRYEQVDKDGVAKLDLPRAVGPGRATLHFDYDAPFNRSLRGLYRIKDGKDWYAFTQFEPIAARRCFPSFDEPRFKTPFDVTIVTGSNSVAIANSGQVSEEPAGSGRKRVRFRKTKPLPTYLVAFAVGPFDVAAPPPLPAAGPRRRPLQIRGVSVRGKASRLAYALEEARELLPVFERYLGVAYPYDKLDLIAVPDFAAGAMENAGAITFREARLLHDRATIPAQAQRAFLLTLAHEIAHQWFGNLVTMRWWDDLWLSEALSTWLQTRIVQRWRPVYRPAMRARQRLFGVMNVDSLSTARKIRQPIRTNDDIHSAFDLITYRKGSAVMAMFESFVGRNAFRGLIRKHLQRFAHGVATTDDLLSSLSAGKKPEVGPAMRTFVERPGVPLIQVRHRCDDGRAKLTLRQRRYAPVGAKKGARQGSRWAIPICMRLGRATGAASKRCLLLEEQEKTIDLGAGCLRWVFPNADGAGYYRFSLPARDVVRLARSSRTLLSPLEQLALAQSIRAAFAANLLDVAQTVKALSYIAKSSDRFVATAAIPLLRKLQLHFVGPAERDAVKRFGRELYRSRWRILGFDPRPGPKPALARERSLFRAALARYLALVAHEPVVRAEAIRRGTALIGFGTDQRWHPKVVEPDLVETVLTAALEERGVPFLDALVAILAKTRSSRRRAQILHALGDATVPAVATKVRALVLTKAVRPSQIRNVLREHFRWPANHAGIWAWLRKSFDRLVKRIPAHNRYWLAVWLGSFCEDTLVRDVRAFVGPRVSNLPGGPRFLANSLERAERCVALVKARGEQARAFFRKQKSAPVGSEQRERGDR